MNKRDNINSEFGIVVLMDALGVKNNSVEEAKKFISFIKNTLGLPNVALSSIVISCEELKEYYEENPPIIRTFGDTILIAWEILGKENPNQILKLLSVISHLINGMIVNGIHKGFLLRGAISVGDFLHDENTLIGPAITDSAEWFEEADWFGCITTPSCTLKINSVINGMSVFGMPISHDYIDYEVPLKSGKTIRVLSTNWPALFSQVTLITNSKSNDAGNIENVEVFLRASIRYHLSCLRIPKGTESKYKHSLDFFDYSIQSDFIKMILSGQPLTDPHENNKA
ncbi:hypothetical protein [Methylophaga pinxianii]|uniref:hypothetical protein n=1 Tax=Methylophaga pinxianii TaxID=2881052 RepID=UPI001CF37BEF|nr:hypothetical protein [Methylophaga pinxianii]MCB2426785.1 hypothetical protein [Methylophaga pinxianii]UPH46550.1 hypothetical protein LGT42_004500 [Methylophaga pinxianii]